MNLTLFLVIGLVFSPFGALAAFFITYEEYLHHVDKHKALKHAFETAIFTFFVFLLMSLLAGYFFMKFI